MYAMIWHSSMSKTDSAFPGENVYSVNRLEQLKKRKKPPCLDKCRTRVGSNPQNLNFNNFVFRSFLNTKKFKTSVVCSKQSQRPPSNYLDV